MAFASEFEKDRMTIMENKELSEEQKQEEMKTLLDEKVEIEKVSDRLLEICEEGGIKLATIDLNDLYCFENEDTNT
jgi:MarR-like DNA-binding transcriptional regulator SgrR of sgrS sRNA